MTVQVYHYPNCTSCKKALSWLKSEGVDIEARDIVKETPNKEEMTTIYQASGLPLKKFFNTSGMKYRELALKDKLDEMSDDEQLDVLVSDGMLIKRPIVFDGKKVTLGFKEQDFIDNWKNS
ncbi:arsenate reductase family protein [Kurthia sibirica]|uniref:Arsenate reductase family protein n=1 Tax=Kurthia sibirica TaxID=202750 RepID=A0A2U3AIK5_9BACL|nr:arsenate reductase family protein [Kurthia sibirica]PWI24392.1 hypothetical protein DEX24_13730 [Kurthia sibirica]GEK33809.1 hypothetical protein KSI01_13420 [Kurthia sibirica]